MKDYIYLYLLDDYVDKLDTQILLGRQGRYLLPQDLEMSQSREIRI